jgi:hypothetical protein
MAGDFVSSDQAAGVGGNSQPPGAQADNTYQSNKIKQLIVMVRYKPAPPAAGFDTAGASSILDGVTGAVQGAASAAENAAASIPGLNMFIKEEKTDSTSEKEYTYYKDYSGWDSVFSKIESGLKEMNSESQTDKFEFSSTNADGRKNDAKELLNKVKSKISGWSKYSANIHFIGIGQGGNVVNECTDLLAKDSQFSSEKWLVKSVIYVGTPLYKNLHLINKEALKKQGGTFSFSNVYDLTQNAIECFDGNEKLLKLIEDSNKNTLSLATGKVKLRLVQLLAIVLSGMNISVNDTSQLNKFDKIKDEAKGMVEDVLDIVKRLTSEGASFAKLGDLPEFSKITNGYSDIPNKVSARLGAFIDDFTNKVKNQAKSANMSLSPADLAGVLNCLCPLFEAISSSMSIFKYESKTSADLARQIIESAGITKVYPVTDQLGETLPVDESYTNKVVQTVQAGKPDKTVVFIKTIREAIAKAAEGQNDANNMNSDQKTLLAEAIMCMVQPMLASKKKLYRKLLEFIPLDVNKLTESISADKLMAIPGGMLQQLNIIFPQDLKTSMANTDGQIKRITKYFDKNEFDTQEDSMYFIYNSHNLILKKMYGPIANCIDKQTGYLSYMKSKGYDNDFSLSDNNYKQGSKQEKTNVMPAREV